MAVRGTQNTWEQRGVYLAQCLGLKPEICAKNIDRRMAASKGIAASPAARARRAGSRTSTTPRTRTRKAASVGT